VPVPKLREIIRNHRFEDELRAIQSHVKRADELVDGVEIILARSPECGSQLEDSHVWFVPGYTVTLAVYYTFDEDHVILLSVKEIAVPE
jgi:hypothetical protein